MTQVSTQKTSVKGLLESESIKGRLNEILGKNASTFAASVMQIVKSNDKLMACEPNSIVGAAMTAATLNLPLNNNLGFAYIIPFNEKQADNTYMQKAQFQLSYRGYIQLAQRSGQYKTINVSEVKEGEIASMDNLTGEIEFRWLPKDKKREALKDIGYVAYFRLVNGFEKSLYMSIDELNAHGKRFSKTFGFKTGLWQQDFDSMAKKTVLKLLIGKYGPLSIDVSMQIAVQTDQASFNDAENTEDITYVDNEEVKKDPDAERMRLLIDSAQTEDDFDFARSVITDPVLLAELDLKEVELKKGKK